MPRLARPAVMVGKPTVPVGTAAELDRRASALAPSSVDLEVAWNPEFLREGYAVQDTLHPDRMVLGVQPGSVRAESAVRELYAPLLDDGVPFLLTDLQTAELVNVSANAFLATKIDLDLDDLDDLADVVKARVLADGATAWTPGAGLPPIGRSIASGGGRRRSSLT